MATLRQVFLGLVLVATVIGAYITMERESARHRPRRPNPQTARRDAGAPRTARQQPGRNANPTRAKGPSAPDRDPNLPYAPTSPPSPPPTAYNAPPSNDHPVPPSASGAGGEPTYARRDNSLAQPPPSRQRPETNPTNTSGGSSQSEGLVVGIVRVQKYPSSCVIWGFIYNSTGAKIDMDVGFRLRDARGDLCQKAMTQFQGQEWTIHDDQMLYFWPAFTWNSLADGAPEGYANGRKAAEMGALEVSVAGRRFVLTVDDDTTSLGPLRTLEAGLEHRIRMQLGSFPDNYLGTQPMGR